MISPSTNSSCQFINQTITAESAPLPDTDSGAQASLNRNSSFSLAPARVWEGLGRNLRHAGRFRCVPMPLTISTLQYEALILSPQHDLIQNQLDRIITSYTQNVCASISHIRITTSNKHTTQRVHFRMKSVELFEKIVRPQFENPLRRHLEN